MNNRTSQNVSASVHQRLLNIARKTDRPFDEVLQYFTMERFLYRLSQTEHVDSFVLKGAQASYPALLDLPAPTLRIYPPETVVAEKAEAMVHLGSLNSRVKDFYDILEQISRQRTGDFCRGFGMNWQISVAGIFVYS